MTNRGSDLISSEGLLRVLDTHAAQDILIIDTRVYGHYAQSRVPGALNICIPTTLLKRPAYSLKKLGDTLSDRKADKAKFESWQSIQKIIVYDAASWTLAQAAPCIQLIQKFLNERWQGTAYILKGGFNAFAEKFEKALDKSPVEIQDDQKGKNPSVDRPGGLSLAGGCNLPTENSVKPFFNTIRQNMDLIDGVGQLPVRRPHELSKAQLEIMPTWLKQASDPGDQGKVVSERFLAIEKAEQQRMQKALSSAAFTDNKQLSPDQVRMAGIEKGTKNRYKDILPFESSRVKLKEKNSGDCDYVNASHVLPSTTNLHYIACQAPVPPTFRDFWRVVWEQGARVIVMLTAESEQGHLKAHPYWTTGTYGPFDVNLTHEEDQLLSYAPGMRPQRTFSTPLDKPFQKSQLPPLNRRHTSNASASNVFNATLSKNNTSPEHDTPQVTIRRLELRDTRSTSQAPRLITQIQLASWPDTGATARPKDILAMVDLCDSLDDPSPINPTISAGQKAAETSSAARPLIVHCSAGCGRTGAFCTVANVKRMLKTQTRHQNPLRRAFAQNQATTPNDGDMDIDGEEWLSDDRIDLIDKTVREFRLHRMSMVQTLRQFVLCYEAVMELFVHDAWMTDSPPEYKAHKSQEDAMDVDKKAVRVPKAPAVQRPALGKRALSGI